MLFKSYSMKMAMLLAFGVSLSACSSRLAPLPPITDYSYRLGTGDEIRVITFGEDKLTAQFQISDNGTFAMPLLGNVRAAGLTPSELGSELSTSFEQKKLLRNASISVEVTRYRPIFVLGEVTKPGEYPYSPRMTVAQAAAKAGGYTYRAVTATAQVVRTQGAAGEAITGSIAQKDFVLPGDTVTFEERLF